MFRRPRSIVLCLLVLFYAVPSYAFLEDLCLPRQAGGPALNWCLNPNCLNAQPNRACPQQFIEFGTIKPGRSMIHADSTYFIAQALGYRADVAYWIAAYNEVTDYTQYVPIDQCGVQAANENTIASGKTLQTAVNSGRDFITAEFNGFQRTNLKTDGPLDHYIVSFSPNGQGTDVHGAGGVQALYPFHYPQPGYPLHIDDTYQKTLANLRQWGMRPSRDPGLLCAVGLTDSSGTRCLTDGTITGKVPLLVNPRKPAPLVISTPNGPKILDLITVNKKTVPVYYDKLESYLNDPAKTTGKLWLDRNPGPVPVQIARFGLYLHTLQDSSSHATYCGDDAPSPPGGGDIGTYMSLDPATNNVTVNFGGSCGMSPHLAGHVQETGTGNASLPLRVYVALNNTVDELIVFGNEVAKQNGWIVNPELLPPDVVGGRNGQGQSAADLQTTLVGVVQGVPYSRTETYQSGVVTLPLQQTATLDRLHKMNEALAKYSSEVAKKSGPGFTPFVPMPGNSADPKSTSVCWKAAP